MLAAVIRASGPAPQRIVSLIPATTEMLFAIGAGDRVVGVGSYDRYPPDVERLPRVGALLDPNVERLIALKPDLVVVYDTQVELKEQLAAAGIPIFRYIHRGLPGVMETIRALGQRVGAKEKADALADRIERELAAVRARVADRPHPRTLLVFGREPGSLRRIQASGGYGFLHDMLEAAGGRDVLGDIPRESVEVSTEMLIARAPEVILELRYGEGQSAPRPPVDAEAWNAVPSVPAVRSHRIFTLVGDELVVPGPRVAAGVRRLAVTLHPDVFK
jgi:iron complex transport system substrate-binding protein